MKPRVVLLSAFLSPHRSGAEACAEEVANRLKEHCEITIVTARMKWSLPRRDTLGEVPVVRVGVGFWFDKWLYPFLAPLAARKFQPQLVHAVLETFAGLALVFCHLLVPKARRLLTLQTLNRRLLKGFIVRSPDAVTAISQALVRRAEDLGRSDITHIPNGIPFERITRACQQYPKVKGRVLFVGRLEPMKGVDTLLTAFANVATKNDAVHLHIVGDGSKKKDLQRQCKELGLMERVTILGRKEDQELFRAYAEAEIFCGLSRSEALGNVFLEAQAASCSVVGTNVGGIPEIVRDGETGLLVPPDNPTEASGALLTLLGDPSLRGNLANLGREHARKYDWDAISRQYEEVYRVVLGGLLRDTGVPAN